MLSQVSARLPLVAELTIFDFLNGTVQYHRTRFQIVLEQLQNSLIVKRMFESPLIDLTTYLEHLRYNGMIRAYQLAIRNGLVSYNIQDRIIHNAIPGSRYRLVYKIDWMNPIRKPITIVMRRFDDLQTVYMIPIYPYDGPQAIPIRSNVYASAHQLIRDILSL